MARILGGTASGTGSRALCRVVSSPVTLNVSSDRTTYDLSLRTYSVAQRLNLYSLEKHGLTSHLGFKERRAYDCELRVEESSN